MHSGPLPANDDEADALNYSEHLKAWLGKHKLSELEKISDSSKKLILKFDIALPTSATKVFDLKLKFCVYGHQHCGWLALRKAVSL